MRLFYERTFLKDVKIIGDLSIKKKIETVLTSLGNAQNIGELSSVKKLKGHKSAYRIRIGDYRIGFFSEGETITLVRVLHRNRIYEYFP
jgi:mRNA-degrading endonuclease RelE of RelBE toxin-antitoxin system